MKLEDLTQEFIDWLKDRNYWEYYEDNFDDRFVGSTPSTKDYIEYAFNWDETPQGFSFWGAVSQDWVEYLNNKKNVRSDEKSALSTQVEGEYTGGSSSYYKVFVKNPTTLEKPYEAEANDIIEALELNFAEGNIFKAIWRRAVARKGKKKKGYTSGLYDAEKINFFSNRLLMQERVDENRN